MSYPQALLSTNQTHLENFLESLKGTENFSGLPNDLQRYFASIAELDTKAQGLGRQLDTTTDEFLRMANHQVKTSRVGDGGKEMIVEPTVQQLGDIRHQQWQHYHLSNEKIIICDQAIAMVKTFIGRLDVDSKNLEVELGPDAVSDMMEPTTARQHMHPSKGKPGKKMNRNDAPPEAPILPFVATSMGVPRKQQQQLDQAQAAERAANENSGEPVYCTCRQVSFGEMVGCDNDACRYEWFHYACVGLKRPPKGKWYCADCRTR